MAKGMNSLFFRLCGACGQTQRFLVPFFNTVRSCSPCNRFQLLVFFYFIIIIIFAFCFSPYTLSHVILSKWETQNVYGRNVMTFYREAGSVCVCVLFLFNIIIVVIFIASFLRVIAVPTPQAG